MQYKPFDNAEFVEGYAERTAQLVPGYAAMQRMAAQLIAERMGPNGRILVLGAGGGTEIVLFHSLHPDWAFIGVEPAREMLALGQKHAESAGADVEWVHGYAPDAPRGPFDAATCLLTLQFVPDNGEKLSTLRELRERLKPGAPFVLVDLSIEKAAAESRLHFVRHLRWGRGGGADSGELDELAERMRREIHTVSAERNEALLREAGFGEVSLFYAALSWRGWVGYV